jgi:hypothetical protein
MLAFMQLIFRYGFEVTKCPFFSRMVVLVLSTVLLGAAGYVINDILIRIPH